MGILKPTLYQVPTTAITCMRYDNGWLCVICNASVKKRMVR